MAEYFHGVSTRQVDTSVSTPVTADSGIAFVVGAAPAHTVGGSVNDPIMCQSYAEAVAAMGYSDNWGNYPICEAIYAQFKLYGVSPVVFVNILDPAKHKKSVSEQNYTVTDGKVLLPLEALKDTVKVTDYTAGEDFDLFYEGENLILEVIEGGSIPERTGELTIAFDAVDPSKIAEKDIIGGFEVSTKKYSGLELIDKVFPKYGIVCDMILAPGWSHKSTVAAAMRAKAETINGVFHGAKALIDIDTTEVTHYADAPAWKKTQNIVGPHRGTDDGDRFGQRRLPGGKSLQQVFADRPGVPCRRDHRSSRPESSKLSEQQRHCNRAEFHRRVCPLGQ